MFLFLGTDDFWRDYNELRSAGIRFVREPKERRLRDRGRLRGCLRELVDLVELKRKRDAH